MHRTRVRFLMIEGREDSIPMFHFVSILVTLGHFGSTAFAPYSSLQVAVKERHDRSLTAAFGWTKHSPLLPLPRMDWPIHK